MKTEETREKRVVALALTLSRLACHARAFVCAHPRQLVLLPQKYCESATEKGNAGCRGQKWGS